MRAKSVAPNRDATTSSLHRRGSPSVASRWDRRSPSTGTGRRLRKGRLPPMKSERFELTRNGRPSGYHFWAERPIDGSMTRFHIQGNGYDLTTAPGDDSVAQWAREEDFGAKLNGLKIIFDGDHDGYFLTLIEWQRDPGPLFLPNQELHSRCASILPTPASR